MILTLTLLCTVMLCACSQLVPKENQLIIDSEISKFSWEEVLESVEHAEESGMLLKTEDFYNVDNSPIYDSIDAIERAKEEVTEWRYLTHVLTAYDEAARVWKVFFWDPNAAGGSVTVYMDENGVTLLCTGGE